MLEFKQLLPYLPFLSAAVVGKEINTSNIISRLIEVGIIGGVILYASVQVLDSKFSTMEKDIIKCNDREKVLLAEIKANTTSVTSLMLQMETLKIQAQYNNELLQRHIQKTQHSEN